MQKFKGFWLAVLAILFLAGSAHALSLETGQPMVAEKGAEESPSQIKFVVTSQDDYAVGDAGDYYYTYVYFMDGVKLAHSIGQTGSGKAITLYESGAITAAQAKQRFASQPAQELEFGVGAPTATDHLTLDQPGLYGVSDPLEWGVWGLKGSDWMVVRIPASAANQVTSDADDALIFTIRNLCIDLTNSPLAHDDLVRVALASPAVNVSLDHYPTSHDRDDTIAAYPTRPSIIAVIGPQVPFDITVNDCPKSLVGKGYVPDTTVPDCPYDPSQDECITYEKCFVLERTDGSSILNGKNIITLDPSAGVYIKSGSVIFKYQNDEGSWIDIKANSIDPSYFGTCEDTKKNNYVNYAFDTGDVKASRLGVFVSYQVNTSNLNVGDQLTMAINYKTNAERICGSNVFKGSTFLATIVGCDYGYKGHSIYFPYAYWGIGGWDSAIAISNLDRGDDVWDLTYEITDAAGVVHVYKKTAVAGKQDVFYLNDVIGNFDGGALTAGTGILRIYSNRSIDGFAYYQGPSVGAGVNARIAD